MILPKCKTEYVSYVEYIRRHDSVPDTKDRLSGVSVKTFVSHWWGEEFATTMKCLDTYAKSKEILWGLPWKKTQKADVWSFWICAFCNNQFAIDHAVGVDGNVLLSSFATALMSPSCTEVVAIIDQRGMIYRRIWCAFELFFVAKKLPKKEMVVKLVNERGVISDGAAVSHDMKKMKMLMDHVRTATAEATMEADKRIIQEEMRREGVAYADLDKVLRDLAKLGLLSYWQRRRAPILLVCSILLGASASLILYGVVCSFYATDVDIPVTLHHAAFRLGGLFLQLDARELHHQRLPARHCLLRGGEHHEVVGGSRGPAGMQSVVLHHSAAPHIQGQIRETHQTGREALAYEVWDGCSLLRADPAPD